MSGEKLSRIMTSGKAINTNNQTKILTEAVQKTHSVETTNHRSDVK